MILSDTDDSWPKPPWQDHYERILLDKERRRVDKLCNNVRLEEQALLLIYHNSSTHRAQWFEIQSLLERSGVPLSDYQVWYLVKRLLAHKDVDGRYESQEEYRARALDYIKRYPQSCVYGWVAGSPKHSPPEVIVRQEWYATWCVSRMTIFLCHASEDKESARTLRSRLMLDGINTWFDENDLIPGQDWQLEIGRAVKQSDAVIILLSKWSVAKRGFVQKEIRYALDVADEQPEGSIFILPAKLNVDTPVPDRLRRWQWVTLHDDAGYQRLLSALRVCATLLDQRRALLQKSPEHDKGPPS